jgi:predicted Fe-Mo cluster-binding NifX family protein
MTIKLALATTDRLTVYTHFGQAREFHIVEVEDDDSYVFTETRQVTPACTGGGHSENAFDAIIEQISDCDAVVVGQIGQGAADYVLQRNIRVFEAPGAVEKIIPVISKMIRTS